jgi:HAD superfamily hydrolase (TIGR01459 family)
MLATVGPCRRSLRSALLDVVSRRIKIGTKQDQTPDILLLVYPHFGVVDSWLPVLSDLKRQRNDVSIGAIIPANALSLINSADFVTREANKIIDLVMVQRNGMPRWKLSRGRSVRRMGDGSSGGFLKMIDTVPRTTRLSTLAWKYDLILCDIWGVVHNGAAVFPEAAAALMQFRQRGGSVILISNASRLGTSVTSTLEELKMPLATYDALITSGDITRDLIAIRPGCAVFDIGPGDARRILEGLKVRFTAMHDADLAISSGAFDNVDYRPEDMMPLLLDMHAMNLVLLCANPDVTTELNGCRVQCSGALAELYGKLGGTVTYAGKPQAPIYRRALAVASELRGVPVPHDRILVIGDSLSTDIAGAAANGFASLFVWGGIHREELGPDPTRSALTQLFSETTIIPTAVTRQLIW